MRYNPTICLRRECSNQRRPGDRFCSAACNTMHRHEGDRRRDERQRERMLERAAAQHKDGANCLGCRFARVTTDSERGVECTAALYRVCAPWTCEPRRKESV